MSLSHYVLVIGLVIFLLLMSTSRGREDEKSKNRGNPRRLVGRISDIGSRYLAAREEIYGEYLAANANALLPRLMVPRGIVVSSPNSIPNGEESTLISSLAGVSRQDGTSFRRVKGLFSVNRHRCANTYILLPTSLSFLFLCLVRIHSLRQGLSNFTRVTDFSSFRHFHQWQLQNEEAIRMDI